ncbi:hypothetical protein [Massilia sp. TS11]|uniref:hypothetical protein n=1 Tax=Massilia sp. TS11 TaxID=2908003 RepID=UPI001EDB352A|nr:hypothetical protein [Massilia sp. TS11]MCG2583304.1 hypothetical protein [Massilia sp. TS11]
MTRGPEFLASQAGRLHTAMGACYPGSHTVFRGRDLHAELRDSDWVGLYLFAITGRQFTPQQIRMVHGIWVVTSYPDTRLWNNRVAALATSQRSSSNLGIAAGLALSEATLYGGQAGLRALDFLLRLGRAVDGGAELGAWVLAEKAQRRIYGYGRPINNIDERLPVIMDLARANGLDQGPHVRLAWQVEAVLQPRYPKLRMNFAALHAALLADMGLGLRDYQMLRVPTFLAGMPPCAADAAAKPEASLFPVPCAAVAYAGLAERTWPPADT